MSIYLAAAFTRWEEINGYADTLEAAGYEVESTWHRDAATGLDESPTDLTLRSDPTRWAQIAQKDLHEVHQADLLILFTGPGRGGRHVETGAALAFGTRLHVVGAPEHIFHCLAELTVPTFDAWLAAGAA